MIRKNFFRAGLSFFFITLLLTSCGDEPETQKIIRPVRYQQVFSTGGTRLRSFSGVAQSGLESKLSFKVAGTIKTMNVSVGDNVTTGDLLAELDPNDYRLRLRQAEATLDQAQAQARNAVASYERVRALYENNNASLQELDGARAASESANAGTEAAKRQLDLARLQLSYTRLKAPNNGAISQVNAELNENVTTGKHIVTLTSGSQIEVNISIPELLISKIQENSKTNVSFDAIPDKTFNATVTEVGVASAGMGTTFPVTVRLDQTDPNIRPGMAATVRFQFVDQDQRVRFLVPSAAVVEDREGRFVYVVEPNPNESGYGIIHRKTVQVGWN